MSVRDTGFWDRGGFWIAVLLAAASCTSTGGMSVGIALAALWMLLQFLFTRRLPSFDGRIAAVIGVYILIQGGLAAMSLDPRVSLPAFWAETHRMVPLFFAAMYVRTDRQLFAMLAVFAVSMLVNEGVAVWQFVEGFGGSMWPDVKGQINGSHTHFATQVLLGLPCLALCASMKELPAAFRWFCVLLMLFSCVMLVLSMTRGAWLAIAGTVLIMAILDWRHWFRYTAALASCAAIFFALFTMYPQLGPRLESIMQLTHRSNVERLLMWESAVHIWEDYPVHGIGLDMFAREYNTKYISPLARERSHDPAHPEEGHGHPHNNFLKVLSEGGVIGVAAALMLHGYFFYRLWLLHRAQRDAMAMTFGLAGILMMTGVVLEGLTDTNMNQVPIMRAYWLMMGVLLAGSRIWEEKSDFWIRG